MNIPNLKYKTSLCNSWKQGIVCQKGNFCFFAHGQEELRSMEQNRFFLEQQGQFYLPPESTKFKTTYCKFYSKGTSRYILGDCKLGDNCTFAHNKSQKRQKIYLPKNEESVNQQIQYSQYNPYFAYLSTFQMHSDPNMTNFVPHFSQDLLFDANPKVEEAENIGQQKLQQEKNVTSTNENSPEK